MYKNIPVLDISFAAALSAGWEAGEGYTSKAEARKEAEKLSSDVQEIGLVSQNCGGMTLWAVMTK